MSNAELCCGMQSILGSFQADTPLARKGGGVNVAVVVASIISSDRCEVFWGGLRDFMAEMTI